MQPPPPPDYQTALEEIARLRKQVLTANEKWMKAVERRTLDNRANAGTIRALQKELASIKAHCEYCPGLDKPHGPHND